jgi:hypothetical protein
MHIESILAPHFEIVTDWMVDLAVSIAKDPSKTMTSQYKWAHLVGPEPDPLKKQATEKAKVDA